MKSSVCVEIEAGIAATAAGEADEATAGRVRAHLADCEECRALLDAYRRVEAGTAALRERPVDEVRIGAARDHLKERLADLRRRIVRYAIFPSPLGKVLVARSELGVVWVEYLDGPSAHASKLLEAEGLEPIEADRDLAGIRKDLELYFAGRSRELKWPIDLRLARSDFQRSVLEATAAVPYGAVVSYKRIAQEVGRPEAVRAVAQALRHNPVAIVVPCHRVIGSEGNLVGYAGGKTSLKEKLLSLEGVPLQRDREDWRVERRAMYLLAPGDREYCLPSCPSTLTLPTGIPTLFGSRERAEAAGYRPCTTCRPDLHPLSTGEAP